MKAVILAAGYATRLRPLTDDVPKQLLPIGGRPMLDWILERVRELEEVDEIHLVTNSRFAPDFERWARETGVVVHDDGTSSNDDRLGAVGDFRLVYERAGLGGEELLVLAGDNLFDFSLVDFEAWWRGKGPEATAVALYDCGDIELATHYGIAGVDADDRIVHFVEKPSEPPSTLAATVIYLLPPEHAALVERYLGEGHGADNIGSFLGWLSRRRQAYGFQVEGRWYDIGNRDQLLEADNTFRMRAGLPARETYSLD